jgi:hypothetical protein
MHYPFEPGLITAPQPYDARGIGENVSLSPSDKDWVRRFYPSGATAVPIAAMQLERLDAVAGQQRDFVFDPSATRDYTVGTARSWCSRSGWKAPASRSQGRLGRGGERDHEGQMIKGRRYVIRVRVHYVMSPDGIGLLVF